MNEKMKELKEEIEATLNEEKKVLEHYSRSMERNDNLVGWIEALEYVLHQIKILEEEE